MISALFGKAPDIHATASVHATAAVIGDESLKENASVWPGAVLRGDICNISIGRNSNVQDNSVLHTGKGQPLVVHDNVGIGHNVNLHSCEIGAGSLVGIGAIVLDGAKIGAGSIVAAGSLVPPDKEFPDGVMIMGSPAKAVRALTEQEKEYLKHVTTSYAKLMQVYKEAEKIL